MIWDEWKEFYQSRNIDTSNMCEDGILNEEEWATAPKKILYIMKETNKYSEGLKELLAEEPKYQMWHTVARWSAGLLYDFPDYTTIDTGDVMKKSLRQIASINLKKIAGGSSADFSELNVYAHQDRKFLLQQIDEINPDIIVTCSTLDIVLWLLDLDVHCNYAYDKPIRDTKRNITVIPWIHPLRVNNEESYKNLQALYNSPF